MNTRKSMKLPIIITFMVIVLIVYLFTSIKQTTISCNKTRIFEGNIQLTETINTTIENKKIGSMDVIKKITLPEKMSKKEQTLEEIKNALEETLEYLGDTTSIRIVDNSVIAHIQVNNSELVLLDNIQITDNNGKVSIHIDVNTKSSDVIALKIGDNYSDGEFMQRLKNGGYSCQ